MGSRGKACMRGASSFPFSASSCMANEMLFRFRHCRNAKRRARTFAFCNNKPFQLFCYFVFLLRVHFPNLAFIAGCQWLAIKCDTTRYCRNTPDYCQGLRYR
jgi:hypothetical protein